MIKYQIFLSSCFDPDMQKNRELFRGDLVARFNECSGCYGTATFITDFEYGIPDGLTAEEIMDVCISHVKKADLFMCILGDRYGYPISIERIPKEFSDFRISLMPEAASDPMISFLELEILTACLYLPHSMCFLVRSGCTQDVRLTRLLSALTIRNADIICFDAPSSLTTIALQKFIQYSGFQPISFSLHENHTLSASQLQYLAKKLRYNIVQSDALTAISEYVDSSSDCTFILSGNPNCGKSMCLAEWVNQNIQRTDISVHCWFHEEGPALLSTVLIDLLSQEPHKEFFYQSDATEAFYNVVTIPHPIKQIFILDGIDHLEEAMDVGWLITKTDPSVKVIITSNNALKKYLPAKHTIVKNLSPVRKSQLIQEIFTCEGKSLEYPNIKNIIENVSSSWSLRQIGEGLQQFLRIMKYQPRTPKNADSCFNIEDYLRNFDSLYGIFCSTQLYLQQHFNPAEVRQSITLLALTERGLSRDELCALTNGPADILYQLYFVTIQTEDLYTIPSVICTHLISDMEPAEVIHYRKQLIEHFKESGSDRGAVEICWQLVQLQERSSLIELLSDVHNWWLISSNSSLDFTGENASDLADCWDDIIASWKTSLRSQPQRYEEKEIFAVADTFSELVRLEDAIDVMKILLDRDADDYSKASYCQQIADMYDDLGDERALDYIDLAINYLESASEQVTIDNKIDTYITGMSIYSFFSDKSERLLLQPNMVQEQISAWAEKVNLLLQQQTYVNPNYQALEYHNMAYIHWTMNNYSSALDYIDMALSITRPNASLLVNDYQLKAQILGSIFCENSQSSTASALEEVIPQPDNENLKQAKNLINKAIRLLQCQPWSHSNAYKKDLSELYYIASQNYGYLGNYKKAIEKIDACIALDQKRDEVTDSYKNYYQSAIVRLAAYRQCNAPRYLSEALAHLDLAEVSALKCGTDEAEDYLKSIRELRKSLV